LILWVALQTERGVTDFRDNLLALPWEFGDPGVRLGGSTQDRLSLPRIFKVVLKSTGAHVPVPGDIFRTAQYSGSFTQDFLHCIFQGPQIELMRSDVCFSLLRPEVAV